jgi:mannosyltransferase
VAFHDREYVVGMTDWDEAIIIKEKKTDYTVPALLLLVVIGAALRFYGLGDSALWLDEAFTLNFSQASFWGIWENILAGVFNPPLFYWMEHIVISVFGTSEIALRFLPALFGTITIPVFYLIGKEFKDENVGIIMAAIATFSPFLIWYSQEARAYSLLLLLVAGATYFYFRGFNDGDSLDWAMFAILGSLAFWSHFYAIVIIGSMFVYALIWYSLIEKNPFLILKSICIYILVSLPVIWEVIPLFLKRTSLGQTYGFDGVTLVYETFKNLGGFSDLLLPVFLFLFVVGVIVSIKKTDWKAYFLIWVFIITFAFSYLVSPIIPMLPKYLIFMSIFFSLGIAASSDFFAKYLPKGTDSAYVVLWMSVFFGMMFVPFATVYYPGGMKDDWRGVASYLENQTQPYDIVVPVPNYVQMPLDYYYSQERDGTIEEPVDPGAMITSFEFIREQRSFVNGTVRTPAVYYVVTGDIAAADPSGKTLNWLNHNATLLKEFNLGINIMKGL